MRNRLKTHINGLRIKQFGGDILSSEAFSKAMSQKHHCRSSVAKHSVLTARVGLVLCDFFNKRGVELDPVKVVRISLLHDLGMLGRKERYRNNFVCGYLHPKNSAITAKELWDDIDQKSIAAIRSHMWPLSLEMPHSKEAFVLCMADKIAAVGDWFPRRRTPEIVFA